MGGGVDFRDVELALSAMREALNPYVEADWSVRAGPLEWDCRATAAHVAHDLLAYAGQVAARPADAYLPFDLVVHPEAEPREVLGVVAASGSLLVGALSAADPQVRAWHWGPCDPAGFAAMGVAEVLLHTHDIAEGLGVPWLPPARPCAAVLQRLFPEAPSGDPARVLLWCTGRGELGGRPRLTSWRWRSALSD
ncbi:maleylpyruvate isomerase N-terminal domain-containing protein [Streptomyces sp. NPDC059851]|uniref:maleylpyruvate isomerase N-terminal domain-containing protein n=1 Tax=Streptomyces sp. NPDC059851 TaxID=3346971 RepID=UPI0036501390